MAVPAGSIDIQRGTLTDIRGTVEVQLLGQSDWMAAAENMVISPGDKVSTGMFGAAILNFAGTKTEIAPLSQFIVGRAMENGPHSYNELFLQVGSVISEVTRHEGGTTRFNVITPTSVVGVRGSKMEVSFFPFTGTEMIMHEGSGFAATFREGEVPNKVQVILNPQASGDAVTAFNEWMEQLAAGDKDVQEWFLDKETLDFVHLVAPRQRLSVGKPDDLEIEKPEKKLKDLSGPDISAAGLSDGEKEAAWDFQEINDQPVSILINEEQGDFQAPDPEAEPAAPPVAVDLGADSGTPAGTAPPSP